MGVVTGNKYTLLRQLQPQDDETSLVFTKHVWHSSATDNSTVDKNLDTWLDEKPSFDVSSVVFDASAVQTLLRNPSGTALLPWTDPRYVKGAGDTKNVHERLLALENASSGDTSDHDTILKLVALHTSNYFTVSGSETLSGKPTDTTRTLTASKYSKFASEDATYPNTSINITPTHKAYDGTSTTDTAVVFTTAAACQAKTYTITEYNELAYGCHQYSFYDSISAATAVATIYITKPLYMWIDSAEATAIPSTAKTCLKSTKIQGSSFNGFADGTVARYAYIAVPAEWTVDSMTAVDTLGSNSVTINSYLASVETTYGTYRIYRSATAQFMNADGIAFYLNGSSSL